MLTPMPSIGINDNYYYPRKKTKNNHDYAVSNFLAKEKNSIPFCLGCIVWCIIKPTHAGTWIE
jgi:hypothetical protein